ncbi:Twinfilin A [Suhomyces tanzawaensis NRRL Y-17324]|uniref:Twinfilin A n=1 Tax=Suhomyces tanzawaensis NRRL Y-17324 TaxID=984487 RepID=A0A1E4SMD1_9ASCO|nr:Twinfilin A [Suhomyces tanzawaensis NRRL Y-17324]ODV80670.1 Twinfilin A [Suhomyces tanzawaensis NRRL Y-17324]
MSTQSGITLLKELLDEFKHFSGSSLVIKVSPDNTELVPDSSYSSSGSHQLEQVFDDLHKYISKEFPQPSYIVIPTSQAKDDFIFVSFIPDEAPIRQKMLYASTKNTLINSLGSNNFSKSNTFSWTELLELTIDHYEFVRASKSSSGPLTNDEQTLNEINLQDLSLALRAPGGGFKQKLASMHSSEEKELFRLSDELQQQFEKLPQNSTNRTLLTLNVETGSEEFQLTSSTEGVAVDALVATLEKVSPTGHPLYSIYNYQDGKFAFIYSCPSGSKVKDRMFYASSKLGLINSLKSGLKNANLTIDKSLEVGDLEELEISELKQTQEAAGEKSGLRFSKPKGPRRR